MLASLTSDFQTAIKGNKFQEALRLIESGADVNEPDEKGRTPLILLCHTLNVTQILKYSLQEYAGLITALINKGADLDAQDNQGNTALHYALEAYLYEDNQHVGKHVVNTLMKAGAQTKISNHEGMTAKNHPAHRDYLVHSLRA